MSQGSARGKGDNLSVSQTQASGSSARAGGRAAANRGLLRRMLPWGLRSLGLLVLVALGFLGVDLIGGLELMLDARLEYLIPAFSTFCLALALRMAVWMFLARRLKLGYHRQWSYARLFLIGWSAGLGLPKGASPLARAAVLAADNRSVGRGVTIDAADRLLQVATFLVLLVVGATYLSAESTRLLRGIGIGVATTGVAALLVLVAAWYLRPLLHRILAHRWIKTFADDVRTAIGELRRTPGSVLAMLFSLALIASLLSVTALFLTSRSLDVGLSFPVVMAAFAVVSLTVIFPISINGLGPREGIFAAAVAGAGFNSEAGVALGLLWFLMQAVTRLAAVSSWFMKTNEAPNDLNISEPKT